MPGPDELVHQGIEHHQRGQLPQAETLYRQALGGNPQHAQAMQLLAVVCDQSGRSAEAVHLFQQAIKLAPQQAAPLRNMAQAYRRLGYDVGAEKALRQSIALQPDFYDAHLTLAMVLRSQGRSSEALTACDTALGLRPGALDAIAVWASCQLDLDRPADAIARLEPLLANPQCPSDAPLAYVDALVKLERTDDALRFLNAHVRQQPRHAPAWLKLSELFEARRDWNNAAACLRQIASFPGLAVEVQAGFSRIAAACGDPDPAAHHASLAQAARRERAAPLVNEGSLLQARGFLPIAEAAYRKALEIEPELLEAYNNLASIFIDQEKLEEAERCFREALQIAPDHPVLHNNLSGVLRKQERVEEARREMRLALDHKPDERWGELRLATTCPIVFPDVESIDAFHAQMHRDLEALAADPPQLDLTRLSGQSCQPSFELQFHGRSLRPVREAFARVVRGNFKPIQLPARPNRPRVGYLVTRKHERAFLGSMLGVVAGMARSGNFDQVVFGSAWGEAKLKQALAPSGVQVAVLPERFDQMAETLAAAACDVLYHWEIGTDPMNYFLPLLRLAPVQCTSMGLEVTSGMEEVDYYISSKYCEVDHAQQDYTERLLNLDSLDTFRPGFDAETVAPLSDELRRAWQLTPGRRIYACPQQIGKFHPDFDPILAGILEADEDAEIVITSDTVGYAAKQLRLRFERTLGPLVERVRMVPWLARPNYLSLIAASDVLLDPLHFTGVTTTFDSLWLGVPIVTLPTDQRRGRYTTACYRRIELDESTFAALNAETATDYVQMAVTLAKDPERRRHIGEELRSRRELLFADQYVVSEHQRALEMMIEQARSTTS